MKKLLVLLISVVFVSCSQDQVESTNPVVETSLSVLDGKLLSYKDEKSFVKEYSDLSKMNSSELQKWISDKKLNSLLNSSSDSLVMQEENLSNSRIIYSDAMKAILNNESKVKIGSNTLWINEHILYALSNENSDKAPKELIVMKNCLEVYGKLLNYSDLKGNVNSNLIGRLVVPNENGIKTYVVGLPNSNRYVLDLFNETIVLNGLIYSSKMYLRYTLQYRSCSFWRCTWKTDTTQRWNMYGYNLLSTGSGSQVGYWIFTPPQAEFVVGPQTLLLATWGVNGPVDPIYYQYPNFGVSGNAIWRYYSSPIEYPQAISWYN